LPLAGFGCKKSQTISNSQRKRSTVREFARLELMCERYRS
jgi:hypothetical protein